MVIKLVPFYQGVGVLGRASSFVMQATYNLAAHTQV